MNINIYYRTTFSDRNKEQILLEYNDGHNYERNLAHKGWGYIKRELVAVRSLTSEELKEMGAMYRHSFVRYFSWEDLIYDERKFYGEGEYLDKIIEYSKTHPVRHPQILSKKGEQLTMFA